MTGRRIVFIGPTLPPDRRPPAGVAYLPPIRHGDLAALDLAAGDRVLIIDGVYQHYAPIRHKEIMAQLDRGVSVAGAASLGALRAAELAAFGMRGIGRVFALAYSGELVADADVAVLNTLDDDQNARRLTVALVSVLQAVRELQAAGGLDADQAGAVERIARGLHFTERSEQALRFHARRSDAADAMDRVLAALAGTGDVKARDALAAIDVLTADLTSPATHPVTPAHPAVSASWRSSYGLEWQLDRRPLRPGSPVTARDALAWLQLFAPDFPERHRAYARRVAGDSTGAGPDRSAAELLAAAGFGPIDPAARLARPTPATASWTAEERAFTRSFRLRPGRSTYLDLPAEALAGESPEELEGRCVESQIADEAETTGPAAQRRARTLLAERWRVTTREELLLSALERGFRDEAEALRFAARFRPPAPPPGRADRPAAAAAADRAPELVA